MSTDIRWEQRFENFEKAYLLVEEVANMSLESFSDLEKQGVVQRFELLLELSWKTMSDYLKSSSVNFESSPKETIRHAFQIGLIKDGEAWMQAVKKRNETSHTYDSKVLNDIFRFVTEEFYPLARDLHAQFKEKL